MYSSDHFRTLQRCLLVCGITCCLGLVGCDSDDETPVDDVMDVERDSDATTDVEMNDDSSDIESDSDTTSTSSDTATDADAADVDPCEGVGMADHTELCPYEEEIYCPGLQDVLCDELYPEAGRGDQYCRCTQQGAWYWLCGNTC